MKNSTFENQNNKIRAMQKKKVKLILYIFTSSFKLNFG